MNATWYVLEDGSAVDPNECTTVDGALTHKNGAKVAMRSFDCPLSRSVEVDVVSAVLGEPAKDMQAERPRQSYKTRQVKAR